MTYGRPYDDKGDQRRGAARHKLFEPVMIEVFGRPVRAHLLDLSRTGALAHAESPPLPTTRLVVDLMGLAVPARVIWVRAKRFGMRFDEMLSDMMVDRLIGVADPFALSPKPRAKAQPATPL